MKNRLDTKLYRQVMKQKTNHYLLDLENLLTTLRRVTMNQKDRVIDGVNYSRTQLEILMLLSEQDCQTTKKLAEQLLITGGAVTQTVDTLVKRGLVIKEQSSLDRRYMQLIPTQNGLIVINKYRDAHRNLLNLLVLGLTEPEIDTALKVTKKVTSIIFDHIADQPNKNNNWDK
jgi:DNA-binding MarR family transcriptional regulator